MREPFTQLYVHLVWSTLEREPWITADIRKRLYGAIEKRCRDMKCEPISIGGTDDHVHLLIRLNPAVSISDLAKDVKGASSHMLNHIIRPGGQFRWQGAYGAFTLRKAEVDQVKAYIDNQSKHHQEQNLSQEFESTEGDG